MSKGWGWGWGGEQDPVGLSRAPTVLVYGLKLFISLRVVEAIPPITAKPAVILKLELVNTHVSQLQQTNGPNQKNQQPLRTIY